MGVELFNSTVPAAFTPSRPLQLSNDSLVLFWLITVTGGTAAHIEFYVEYTDGDPNNKTTQWFREVDEQDGGNGAVTMSQVVRTIQLNGGGDLPAGTYPFSVPFIRRAQFARVQLKSTLGVATAQITAPFGTIPVS